MKNAIPFNLFGEDQEICLTIPKLRQLERATGKQIQEILSPGVVGVDLCLAALPVCLGKPDGGTYEEKLEKCLESGANINDIANRIVHAILATNILGKDLGDEVMELYYPTLKEEKKERKNE